MVFAWDPNNSVIKRLQSIGKHFEAVNCFFMQTALTDGTALISLANLFKVSAALFKYHWILQNTVELQWFEHFLDHGNLF